MLLVHKDSHKLCDCNCRVSIVHLDNNLLMQFQADISGVPVIRPAITETTALGAAFLAGLSTGVWESCEEISALWRVDRVFEPSMTADRREYLMNQWARAVGRARNWNK